MPQSVVADSISSGWLAGLGALTDAPRHEIYDLVVEITTPGNEDLRVRTAADRLAGIEDWSHTVANTIFPSDLARTSRTPDDLYKRYLTLLPRLIAREPQQNKYGTYFGRLIAYPGPKGPVNQVAHVMETIREAVSSGRARWRFIYDMTTHVPGYPKRPYGFPCLAYINVKLRGDELLMTAHYRNHYFAERAYGNYLGLATLQAYIAGHLGLVAGSLVCISGHAELGGSLTDVRALLREFT